MFDKSQLPDLDKRNQVLVLYEDWRKAADAREDAEYTENVDDAAFDAIDADAEAAEAAYKASGFTLETNHVFDPILCGACGAPVFEIDEYLSDPETGELFLRVALGLPAREVEQELPEMEEVRA